MRLLRYIGRRLVFVVPQLIGIIVVSFFLIKLIPGDPAVLMLGPNATSDSIAALRDQLGLTKPLYEQILIYLGNVSHGNLGKSWQTAGNVADDLLERFPATLELVTLSMLLALSIGIPLGTAAATRQRGAVRKLATYYGLLAGATPDFWLALVLVFVFYSVLHVVPPPLGRLDVVISTPHAVTGSILIDSLLTGDLTATWSALGHLLLPVLTLGLVSAGPIMKMTQSTMERTLASDFIRYADICGLPRHVVRRQAFRASLPAIITIVSVLYSYLIGGAVLVEIVFSWGGAGQYAVQGVLNADINPVLGFVISAALLSLVLYLVVDLLYFALDPRTRA